MKTRARFQSDSPPNPASPPHRASFRSRSVHCGLAALAVLLAATASVNAATVRVNPEELQRHGGLQQIVNTLQPGDICVVSPGDYDEQITLVSAHSGGPDKMTVLQAEKPGTVRVRGIQIVNASHIRIEGFLIPNSGTLAPAIQLSGSHLEILSNAFHQLPSAAVAGTGHHVRLRGNQVLKGSSGFHVAGESWIVEDNRIELENPGIDGAHVQFAGRRHLFRNNQLTGGTPSLDPTASSIAAFSARDAAVQEIVIENNLVDGRHALAVQIRRDPAQASSGISIRNNIFAASEQGAIELAAARDTRIYNNTVVNPKLFGVRLTDASAAEIINNVFFSAPASGNSQNHPSSAYLSEPGGTITARNNLICMPEAESLRDTYPHDLLQAGDPFVSLRSRNYRLRPGSPGIDQGWAMAEPGKDRDGVIRPQGAAWDVGAYEFTTNGFTRPMPPARLRLTIQ